MTQSPASSNQPPAQDNSPGSAQNKPVDKFIDGPVHASIWENSGTKGAFRVASFEIRFKNSADQWQSGRNFTAAQLKHLETAAREAVLVSRLGSRIRGSGTPNLELTDRRAAPPYWQQFA